MRPIIRIIINKVNVTCKWDLLNTRFGSTISVIHDTCDVRLSSKIEKYSIHGDRTQKDDYIQYLCNVCTPMPLYNVIKTWKRVRRSLH